MHDTVDTVVVGSGFGGGVIACRLAQDGQDVLVLERGRSYPPGSFARSPTEMAANFWDPSKNLYGLFNVWSFRNIEAIVSSGLGGGSLIYANVLLRKDERWFADEDRAWPLTHEDLEEHYGPAEEMLGATRYPFRREPYASTGRMRALEDAAEVLSSRHDGVTFDRPNLAVSFTPEGDRLGVPLDAPNLHGVQRRTCTLCAECDIGCNTGAKNSVDLTYLSAAKSAKAVIRDLCEVRDLERDGDGYRVGYVLHDPESGSSSPGTVHAKRVVLAAGALGTTYLLLRNRASLGLEKQAALGTRFCGNGDLLGFARGLRDGDGYRAVTPSRGPVITSCIRMPDTLDEVPGSRQGFYIEDAGWPQGLNWVAEVANVGPLAFRAGSFIRTIVRRYFTREPDSDIGEEVSKVLDGGVLTGATLGLLGMGRDVPDGNLSLKGKYLACDWSDKTSRRYFEDLEGAMTEIARGLGGTFVVNPTRKLGRRLATTHPLGGCPMGATERDGVVDTYGRVFGHDELHVVDGSVMPGPVGANPGLTIAAFAERAAARMTGRT